MKRLSVIIAALLCAASCTTETPQTSEPVDYVSTLVGTLSKFQLSTGNTYPAVALPWGTHFWTPHTGKMGNGWAYVYTDDKIQGFKMTHQPSPWINDYGQFSIMPVTTGPVTEGPARASWFSHKAETATPYYYAVYLADHDTYLELTPTERAAAFRITYPEREKSYLVLDAFDAEKATLRVDGRRIIGSTTNNHGGVSDNFRLWFVVDADTDFTVEDSGAPDRLLVSFPTSKGSQVNLKVAASFISEQQAVHNLSELGDGDFDRLREAGRNRWNAVLSRIEVEDTDIDHLRTFYSCLYRSVLFPRDLSEVTPEGKRVHYSPFDGKVHDGYLFGDTGFWDTFRCLFALVDLLYPEQAAKMQEGLVNTYLESGFLPEWASPGHRQCMVGNNSASVVAEAYLKGLRGYDIGTLWEAVTHGAHSVHPEISSTGRLGWQYYDSLGFVPCNVGIRESAARTLEYAYDDWCIYTLGKALGKPESEIAQYGKAAQNYRNLFRKDRSLMSGRNEDGSFPENFNPLKWGGDFTEGNSLHYTWSVFHDIPGLVELMGGKAQFEEALDGIFNMPPDYDDSYYGGIIHEIREMQIMNMGNYAHGNQPIQHMLYLYDWCDRSEKTQQRVREVMEKFYSAAPDGYCGDEDNGQTSAWYVFSALGFYPVCPASCEYAVGIPLFRKATMHLPGGDFVIDAPGNGRHSVTASSVKLDGGTLEAPFIRHEDLVKGGVLNFNMAR